LKYTKREEQLKFTNIYFIYLKNSHQRRE